jgi:hypothetical protein
MPRRCFQDRIIRKFLDHDIFSDLYVGATYDGRSTGPPSSIRDIGLDATGPGFSEPHLVSVTHHGRTRSGTQLVFGDDSVRAEDSRGRHVASAESDCRGLIAVMKDHHAVRVRSG